MLTASSYRWAGVALLFGSDVAAAAPARVFASPDVAGAAATGAAGHTLQMTLALLLVLALVFALAWFARRLRSATRPGALAIEILAQAALGAKERAILVKVGRNQMLLGVAPGSVRMLHLLGEGEALPAVTESNATPGTDVTAPGFAELLRRSLGRS